MTEKLILVAPNSYKECTDSVSAANLITSLLDKNLRNKAISNFKIITKPISDGGDGFAKVCSFYHNTDKMKFDILTPWGKDKLTVKVEYSERNKTVYIESASVLGLKVIPQNKRNPLRLNSFGLGELLLNLEKFEQKEIEKVVIGIGGTGTSDLGIGMCSAFGMKLFDKHGKPVEPYPVNFSKVNSLKWEKPALRFKLEVVVDVNNPLLGEKGANRTFAEQKGASKNDIEVLENGFSDILKVAGARNETALSGAGGGLAAAFQFFFGAKIILARDFIRNELGISKKSLEPDVLITGEGKVDEQTLMDKGSMIIINEFSDPECKKILVVGQSKTVLENVYTVELSKYFSSVEESISRFEVGMELAIREISERFFVS